MTAHDLLTAGLAGWRMAGRGGFHELGNGLIQSYGGSGLFWYAQEQFADFVLSVEWRTSALEDNSGVFLRIPALLDSPQPAIENGYEVQIDDRGYDPEKRVEGSVLHLTGAIYQLAPALKRCSRPVGEWNHFEITAQGPVLAIDLNGQSVSSLTHASRLPSGHIGLQTHHEGSAVQFRHLRISS
jgi:Domain of Unknown Function (DUF1080)